MCNWKAKNEIKVAAFDIVSHYGDQTLITWDVFGIVFKMEWINGGQILKTCFKEIDMIRIIAKIANQLLRPFTMFIKRNKNAYIRFHNDVIMYGDQATFSVIAYVESEW